MFQQRRIIFKTCRISESTVLTLKKENVLTGHNMIMIKRKNFYKNFSQINPFLVTLKIGKYDDVTSIVENFDLKKF